MLAFQEKPELCAVTGAFDCCDLEGNVTRKSLLPCAADKVFADRELIDLTLGFSGEWFNGATVYRTAVVHLLWEQVIFARTALDLALHVLISLMTGSRVMFLAEPDVCLRVHVDQESQSNNFSLSESAALMAIKLWHFNVKHDRRYNELFRKRFSSDLNRFGRMLWDKGLIAESRAMFLQELCINPYTAATWLRYLRTYFTAPS